MAIAITFAQPRSVLNSSEAPSRAPYANHTRPRAHHTTHWSAHINQSPLTHVIGSRDAQSLWPRRSSACS